MLLHEVSGIGAEMAEIDIIAVAAACLLTCSSSVTRSLFRFSLKRRACFIRAILALCLYLSSRNHKLWTYGIIFPFLSVVKCLIFPFSEIRTGGQSSLDKALG